MHWSIATTSTKSPLLRRRTTRRQAPRRTIAELIFKNCSFVQIAAPEKKLRSMEYLYKWCPNFFWNAFDVARWRCVGSQADVSKHRRQHNKGSSSHLSQGSRQWSQLLQREGYQAITGDESCKLLSRGLPKMPLNSIYLCIPCAVLCTVVLLYSK